jgi:hypothetical protein
MPTFRRNILSPSSGVKWQSWEVTCLKTACWSWPFAHIPCLWLTLSISPFLSKPIWPLHFLPLSLQPRRWRQYGDMRTLTVCLGWWPWHAQTRDTATGVKMNLSAVCPLWKELGLDGCLGVEPRGMEWDRYDWKPLLLRGGWGAQWRKRGLPLFQLYPGICLTTKKVHRKRQSV